MVCLFVFIVYSMCTARPKTQDYLNIFQSNTGGWLSVPLAENISSLKCFNNSDIEICSCGRSYWTLIEGRLRCENQNLNHFIRWPFTEA